MNARWFAVVGLLLTAGRADGGVPGRPGSTVSSLLAGAPAATSPVFSQPHPKQTASTRPSQTVGDGLPQRYGTVSPGIHPAVVRVVAPGRGSISYGSGTLVDVSGEYGLVITNYHVINEATGNISVHFPDGFYSLATVRKIDRDWDLAALVIKRPNAQPVPIAPAAPRPGEPLTIAGYGSGNYRAVAGRCTQYVAPGTRMPFEMVELAASARQGDSGGPILNQRGELAGVLFGEGGGRTAGSYCGRVKWFLASLTDRPGEPVRTAPPMAPTLPESQRNSEVQFAQAPSFSQPRLRPPSPVVDSSSDSPDSLPSITSIPLRAPAREFAAPASHADPIAASTRPSLAPAASLDWQQVAGDTLAEQVKTFLAIFGGCAALMFLMRVVLGGETTKT